MECALPPCRAVLFLVAKYPTPGLAKTRLGREIGMEVAATLARAFLLDLLHSFAHSNTSTPSPCTISRRVLLFTPALAREEFEALLAAEGD